MLFRSKPSLTPEEVAARLARGDLRLVDVREHAELREGRIKGALHIPLGQLGDRVGELDRRRPVAFICRSGARSARATQAALNAGFDAYNVRGGMMAWSRSGLPLSR